MLMRTLFVLVLVCLLAIGCGGGGGSVPIVFKGLKIEPSIIRVKPLESIQLTGIVDGTSQDIEWKTEGTTGGTISSSGKYTAPQASGSYSIKLSLKTDPTKFVTSSVVVDSGYVVKVSGPAAGEATVAIGEDIQLSALVQGAASNEVNWSTDYGTISSTGKLTASPGLILVAPSEVNIEARSVVDPGKKASFKVKLVPFLVVSSVNSVNNAIPGSRIRFTAKVRGVDSNAVTWSSNSGTVSADGTWTAGSSAGDVVVTATSTEKPSQSATGLVSVVPNLNVRFKFETAGDVVLSLRPDKAPNHCANLVSLVNERFYDGIVVHRYVSGFVVQWGDPLTKTLPLTDPSIGTGGPGYSIDFEVNDLLHKKYSLAMARSTSLNSAGSQIYICLDDQPSLDGNYVVFGDTLSGQSVVDALRRGDKILNATVELP